MRNTILTILLVISISGFTQDYSTKSKKAIKFFEKALSEFNNRNDNLAYQYLDAAIKTDPNFFEAYILYANIYHDNNQIEKEIEYYTKVVEINPEFDGKLYYFLAAAELSIGRYEIAKRHLEKCISFQNINQTIRERAEKKLKWAEFGFNSFKNPVPFKPINLGKNVNTQYDDYWPCLTADEEILITTVLLPYDDRFPVSLRNSQEDFFISKKVDGKWAPTQNMGHPINTSQNEGAQTFSADGQWLFYTVCERKEDYGHCDLYFARYLGDNFWTVPQNMQPPISTEYWESQPTVTSDGKTLYFTSNRKGGFGAQDLFVTHMNDDGKWSTPENLGETINTEGIEASPFIHPDGNTLYFTSNGHIGMGGMDIFVSRRDPLGKWSEPVNLGYPINTWKDEIGMIVNAAGQLAYFSSDRDGSRGKDIYYFDLYEEARPVPVTYVKGFVYDSFTKKRLHAKFKLIDLETNTVVVSSESNPENGEYLVCLPTGKDYAFEANKEKYLFFSENFSLSEKLETNKPYEKNIPLIPISDSENGIVVLKNIFFETDSYILKRESTTELTTLINFLNANPKIKIEIRGHTDDVGNEDYNKKLSNNRAKSVYDYLISKGIDKTRLQYKGFGYSIPLIKDTSPEARAQNRRTEFRIISK
ncbi:MAG: PD40 domain-containing protein [Bacteroidales bacterium]|nr:PD40 domain-containing protein [Bacteroidales bacterium]